MDLPSDTAFAVGGVYVHRATHYLFELRVADAETMHFEGPGGYRNFSATREEALSQLRLPIEPAQAEALEHLIVHTEAAVPDADLDLLLYLRGTPAQTAVAIATLIDRADEPARHPHAASDLRFQGLKLLGELAWVQGRAPDIFGRAESAALNAYVGALRARRRAVLSREHPRVMPPHLPVVPRFVLRPERMDVDGWHVLETRLHGAEDWFAATLGFRGFESQEALGAAGELAISTHHLEGAIRWIVLSEHAARVETSEGTVHAQVGAESVLLARRSRHVGQVLVVAHREHPGDLLESIDVRLSYPQRPLLAWEFGLAAQPAMDAWELFTGRTATGATVWAFACGEEFDERGE